MDGMKKNPSHSSRVMHPFDCHCSPLFKMPMIPAGIHYYFHMSQVSQGLSPTPLPTTSIKRVGVTSTRHQLVGPAIQANPSSIALSASSALCKCGAFSQNVCGQPHTTSVLTSTPALPKALA